MVTIVDVLLVVATVGCGLTAGLLFVFSAGVMTALGRLPVARGAAAMQAINTAVLNPLFLGVVLGSALVCAVLAVLVSITGGPALALVGAVVFVVGAFGVTVTANVPMNNALAVLDADSDEGVRYWARYRVRWTAWNHVRVLAATAATALLALA